MKNFKKVISVVMALAMIACSFTAVSAAKFADVADTAAYAEAVQVLEALNVVNGVEQENGTFNFEPEKSVTRAEAATMIVGALNMADDATAAAGTSQFGDVNSQAAWAAGFVNVGVAQGFIAGYDAATFGPLDNVTYAQLCVMLTQITGYGEYAKAYGGWPTGYTTMAATAGINKGVAVANDAALTKGQVAMMIWNALQAPMLGVETYAISGNEYKPLDGKDGDFKTLLSEKFDAYVATVTIDQTPINDGLENDEVVISVTKADWWPLDESPIPDTNAINYLSQPATVAAGIDVNSSYLQTGKAVFLVDEDDQLEMIYFKATGKTAAKELAADTYYLQQNLADSKQYATDHEKIRFGSTYYKFESSIDVYVNGVNYTTITAAADEATDTESQKALDWLLGNAKGTIKILKTVPTGEYDVIFVNLYQVAEVTSVDADNDETRITLAGVQGGLDATAESIDEIVITNDEVEEGNVIVTVTRNGEAATLASLKNGDIIAYAADFGEVDEGILTDPKVIDIIATNDEISGTVTAIDTNLTGANDNVYTIGGANYTLIADRANPSDPGDIDIKHSLDVRLDPFGRIYDYEANGAAAQYAIALKLGQEDDQIKLLLADGTTKTYDVDLSKATNFSTAFAGIDAVANVAGRVVTYEVSGKTGKISAITLVGAGNAITDKEYKSRTSLLGSGNKILDTTPIILVDDDASVPFKEAAKYSVLTKEDLLDGTKYTGNAYRINTTVAFVVITNIGTAFGEDSRFAVAISEPESILTEDGDRVKSVKVLYEGKVQDMLFNTTAAADILVGTEVDDEVVKYQTFFFETDSDGYVNAIYDDFETEMSGLIDDDDWSYKIYDENKPIQIATGVVVDVTSSAITFATVDQVTAGTLDTTLDLDDTVKLVDDPDTDDVDEAAEYGNGIVTYGFAEGCVAYTYDESLQTRVETDKFDDPSPSSIKASNFASFDKTTNAASGILNDGKYAEVNAGDMMAKATVATVMIVDGEVVAIFAIEK